MFTKDEFEQNLQFEFETHFENGQYCYLLDFGNPFCKIKIASSIDKTNRCRDTGEDSIRVWLVSKDIPIGGKQQKWIQRTDGWNIRLNRTVDKLAKIGLWIQPCPKCKEILRLKKNKDKTYSIFCPKKINNAWQHHVNVSLNQEGVKVS